ncbi:MAG: hypothetical protein K5852_08985, partial [Eubacterium sp.]|nr:hypothetical protein [Eubacterium sp.]
QPGTEELPAEEPQPETEELPAEEPQPEMEEPPAEESLPEAEELPAEELQPEMEEPAAEESLPEAEELPAEEPQPETEEPAAEESLPGTEEPGYSCEEEALRSYLTTVPRKENPEGNTETPQETGEGHETENDIPEADEPVPEQPEEMVVPDPQDEGEAAGPVEQENEEKPAGQDEQTQVEEYHDDGKTEEITEPKPVAEASVPEPPGTDPGRYYVQQSAGIAPLSYPLSPVDTVREAVKENTLPDKEESRAKTQIRLIRTEKDNSETDLTNMYSHALMGMKPERVNWRTILSPLPENDGLYTLQVTDIDENGEKTMRETSFSVNRFGSVYTYNAFIRKLRGNTVRKITEPLIISEYNPDPLQSGSWEIDLTHDGKKVEPVQYTVSPAKEEQQESQPGKTEKWQWYDYVISPENFREDGAYRLIVSSADTSGNTTESNRYNGGEIRFTVDGSPPELQTVTGLEVPVVYGETAKITVTAFDAIGLEKVAIFADGKCKAAASDFSDSHRAEVTAELSPGEDQTVRIVVTDAASNTLDTEAKDRTGKYLFRPAYPFERKISVLRQQQEMQQEPQQKQQNLQKQQVKQQQAEKAKKRRHTGMALVGMILGCSGVAFWLLYRARKKDLAQAAIRRIDEEEEDTL